MMKQSKSKSKSKLTEIIVAENKNWLLPNIFGLDISVNIAYRVSEF